ncbi:MAG: hypothetical protein HKN41_05675 [Ilumatobacter sp.]|nr:hypothetical protein [Ilumatobacter sp.]
MTAFAAIGEAGIGHRERAYELLADAEALHADNPAIAPIRQRVVFAPPDAADRVG